MMPTTTWALAVATYKRHDVLRECVRRALAQTRPPSEIVIVDASTNWQDGAAIVEPMCSEAGIPCRYAQATMPSSAVQRNQAIDLATADVLFMIDDDSLLFPDSAERALEIYDADTEGVVAGVQMTPVDAEPSPPSAPDDGAKVGGQAFEEKATGRMHWFHEHALGRWLYRELFMMSRERHFVPYDGHYPDHSVPAALRKFDVEPIHLFTGCAMTYRRSVISKVRFDPLLRSYSPAEDLDASYRASQLGALVVAPRAQLRHVELAAGRVKRRVATCLWATNLALFLRRHAGTSSTRRAEYVTLVARRMFADLLKDAGSKRFDLPQVRGLLQSIPVSYRVFNVPDAELDRFYADAQARILGWTRPA